MGALHGIAGTLPLGDRPEGQRLLQDAEAGAFGCVLVYRLTRLGRRPKALTEAHERLAQLSVTIRSATEPFDTSTPIGTFLFQLLGSLVELDRAQVLEQLSRGRDRVAKDGKWTDGPVPYGYMLDEEGKLTPSTRLVEILEMTEAEVVVDLFQRLAAGSSTIVEAKRLTALGVPTTRYYGNGSTRAGTKWYANSVMLIIKSTTYKGVHRFESRHGTIEREIPALVDEALWARANEQIQRNKRLPKANAIRTYLLRGLITCDHCGSAYVGQMATNRNGSRSVFYRCCGRTPHWYATRQRCSGKVVQVAWIEAEVWQQCREFVLNPEETLAEAQSQLHERMSQAARLAEDRGVALRALAEKRRSAIAS